MAQLLRRPTRLRYAEVKRFCGRPRLPLPPFVRPAASLKAS